MKTLNAEKLAQKVRKFTDTMVNENRIMFGAEYLVRQEGKIVYHDALGVLDENGGTMPKNHMFRIASMTKPVTSAALLIMVDEGKVEAYEVEGALDGIIDQIVATCEAE